ncbi:MAG: hypothetical protein JXB32_05915 [Deltaproteobacteria bacterium]|nr:hypothetical protein [Deltaproteobacteria bacterium]
MPVEFGGAGRAGSATLAALLLGSLVVAPASAQEAVRERGEGDAPDVGLIGGAPEADRKHASGSFAVGAVGTDGFGAGFAGGFAWDLTRRYGIELGLGLGGMQERGGGAVGGFYAHFDVLVPITFNICASVPRVCPALDFEISILPGLGYAYLDGDHAGNVILGFAVSSLRKTQFLDVGVRAAVLGYLDVVGAAVEASADRLLGLLQLQLGCVVRWGVTQPGS